MCHFWPFWPDTHPITPARPQHGPHPGLPHHLAELLVGRLPVTPRVTATPKPSPTQAELARVAREGTRGVVWCGVPKALLQKAMAGTSILCVACALCVSVWTSAENGERGRPGGYPPGDGCQPTSSRWIPSRSAC